METDQINNEVDPVTGVVPQPFIKISIVGILLFTLLGWMAAYIPRYSTGYLYASIMFGWMGFIGLIWLNTRPNLYARFFVIVGFSFLAAMIASRSLGYLFPQAAFSGTVAIYLMVTLAHGLPMWNTRLANLIRHEMYTPRTWAGKAMHAVSWSLLILPGLISTVGTIFFGFNKTTGWSVIILPVFFLIALIMPFASLFPSSPWEKRQQSDQ